MKFLGLFECFSVYCPGFLRVRKVREILVVFEVFLGTILFKIITRIKLFFSNYLGDYSYSFQGSVELICITATVSLLLLQNAVTENNSPQEFGGFLAITVT